jgi:thymidylate kinase
VVVLMVDTATGLSRQGDPDRIGGETDDFHRGVLDGYRTLASAEPDRVRLIEVVDRPETVAEQILKMVDDARG